MRGRCQVSDPRGDEEGQQAIEDALQGDRGNPDAARRFSGREANGMGGRRMLRCPARARREYRVRSGLDYSLWMVRNETQGDGGRT